MAQHDPTTSKPDSAVENEDKKEITFYKTLVIGLGGTGREVCRLLKAFLYSESHGNLKKYNHVKILAIDTRERETTVDPGSFGLPGVDFDGDEEMTLTVEQDIDINRYPWFDESQKAMLRNLKGEGAGARRQIGRLILLENWSKVFDKIRFKINDLQDAQYDSDFKREWPGSVECKSEISIYMVGNLVSGTGSGMMLEMGYLINSLRDHYQFINNSIAITTIINKKYQEKANRMINSVAALRELNHFYHQEIYGNVTTCFKIEAPSALFNNLIPQKKLARMYPPYDRIFLTDLDSFSNAPMEPEQAHYLISRFLYHQTGTHVGAHFRGKYVDDKWSSESDREGNPLACKSFGVISVIDQKPTIDRRCAFRLAERVIQCISGEDDITLEWLKLEGLDKKPLSGKNYVPQPLGDYAKAFAERLSKEMQDILATQFEDIKDTMQGVPTGTGIKHLDYIEKLVKQAYSFSSNLSSKEFPIVLESRRKYLDQQFNEIRNQVRKRAYMKKSKDISWKSLFDIIREKIEEKIFTISNVTIPQEEDFSGSLHSAERFLYYLTYEKENLLTDQVNSINKGKNQHKTKSESLLAKFNNAESQMKVLYKQHFGKPAWEQAVREFSELAGQYYQECLQYIIWERCSLILSGDASQSGEDESYRKGILNLSKELYIKYKKAYDRACTIDNWFNQAYLNEQTVGGGLGMVSLPAKTDEDTIYQELLKNPEKISNLIKKILEDYANGVPYELETIDDNREKQLREDLFKWCLADVSQIAVRPSFDDIFKEEVELKENLKEHLTRALPMMKFEVNRLNATGIRGVPGYCSVSIPTNAETLQKYIKEHDSFKNVNPTFLERVDKVYDVDMITASHSYNPSVSQRVQELCSFYEQEKNTKNLHLFPEYSLLTLGGTEEQNQTCFDLAVAMSWLRIDRDEKTLKYFYTYENEYMDNGETPENKKELEKEVKVYNWKTRANPIQDQLWKSIATKSRDPQNHDEITVLKDILNRIRKEIRKGRDNFIRILKAGVNKIRYGETNLLYKEVKLGDEVPLFKAFAELIGRVIGENPVTVDEWLKKKPGTKKTNETPNQEPQEEKPMEPEVKSEIPEKSKTSDDETKFDLPPLKGDEPEPEEMPENKVNRELSRYIIKTGLPREKREELMKKCEDSKREDKNNLLFLLRNLPRKTGRLQVLEEIKSELSIEFSLD